MKAFIIGLVVLSMVVIGGYVGLKYVGSQKQPQSSYKTESVAKIGVIQTGKGDDYTHLLVSEGTSIGLASYTVKLDDYLGKKVQVQGQFSGTTLYADSVAVLP